MILTEFERRAIEKAYFSGVISREEYVKLLGDITLLLWAELYSKQKAPVKGLSVYCIG